MRPTDSQTVFSIHPPPSTLHPPSAWGLYVITDRSLTGGRPLEVMVGAACAGGAKAIQLREKNLSTRDLYQLVERLLPIVHGQDACLLINDRVDLALALPVDGVHLSRLSLPPAETRALLGSRRLIGVSCHTLEEAIEAERGGADFIVFGSLFPTPSKVAYGPPVGLTRLGDVRRRIRLPILGIGGITVSNAPSVMAAGADGVAVIATVMMADDPADAVSGLLHVVRSAVGNTPTH